MIGEPENDHEKAIELALIVAELYELVDEFGDEFIDKNQGYLAQIYDAWPVSPSSLN